MFNKRVCINKTNIRKGKPTMLDSCPVALACKRELRLKGKDSIQVDDEAIDVVKDGVKYSMRTPVEAAEFIEKFDDELIPRSRSKPFCFQLDLKKKETFILK